MSGLSTRLLSGLLHIQRTELGTRAAAENVSQFVYDLAEGSLGGKQSKLRGGVRACVSLDSVASSFPFSPSPPPLAVACKCVRIECLLFILPIRSRCLDRSGTEQRARSLWGYLLLCVCVCGRIQSVLYVSIGCKTKTVVVPELASWSVA